MNCIYCKDESNRRANYKGNQIYQCKTCKRCFLEEYSRKSVDHLRLANEVVKLNREGVGIRSIARLLETASQTILRIMKTKLAEISEQKSKKKMMKFKSGK